jgi:hypothetical protein
LSPTWRISSNSPPNQNGKRKISLFSRRETPRRRRPRGRGVKAPFVPFRPPGVGGRRDLAAGFPRGFPIRPVFRFTRRKIRAKRVRESSRPAAGSGSGIVLPPRLSSPSRPRPAPGPAGTRRRDPLGGERSKGIGFRQNNRPPPREGSNATARFPYNPRGAPGRFPTTPDRRESPRRPAKGPERPRCPAAAAPAPGRNGRFRDETPPGRPKPDGGAIMAPGPRRRSKSPDRRRLSWTCEGAFGIFEPSRKIIAFAFPLFFPESPFEVLLPLCLRFGRENVILETISPRRGTGPRHAGGGGRPPGLETRGAIAGGGRVGVPGVFRGGFAGVFGFARG